MFYSKGSLIESHAWVPWLYSKVKHKGVPVLKNHTKNMYGDMEVTLCTVLTLAQDGEWSVSHAGCTTAITGQESRLPPERTWS